MTIEIVYCFPTILGDGYTAHAERFLSSYLEHPPMIAHRSTIVCNGAAPTLEQRALFAMLPEVKFITGSNAGLDIGAYQEASSQSSADVIVFFGASAYVRVEGWLLRMARAFERHGPAALYGTHGNCGDARVGVYAHLRTTGFFATPTLINTHPLRVTNPSQRYPYEHGVGCLSEWCRRQGYKRWVVTRNEDYPLEMADTIPNGFHRGDQSALLAGDRLTCPPYFDYA